MLTSCYSASIHWHRDYFLLSCQPRVTVMSCFVYKVIRDFELKDHLCINPIQWI